MKEEIKVFFMGFSMKGHYDDEGELIISGFWSFIVPYINPDSQGFLFIQYKGSYWKVLWKFLKGNIEE